MSEQRRYQIHPYAKLFPALDEDDLMELAEDIRVNGLQNPIWLDDDGLILDGRNRSAACLIAGIEPRYQTFHGDDEQKLRFVCSQNIRRRHLDTSQRAMIAATMVESFEALAKTRQAVKENFPEVQRGQSRDQAGAAMNVSGKTVDMAKKVIAKAAPEVVEAVTKGDLAVSRAAKIADLPKEQQVAALEAAPTARTKRQRRDLWLCLVDGDPLMVSEVATPIVGNKPLTGYFVFLEEQEAVDEGLARFTDSDGAITRDVTAQTVAEFLKEAAGL